MFPCPHVSLGVSVLEVFSSLSQVSTKKKLKFSPRRQLRFRMLSISEGVEDLIGKLEYIKDVVAFVSLFYRGSSSPSPTQTYPLSASSRNQSKVWNESYDWSSSFSNLFYVIGLTLRILDKSIMMYVIMMFWDLRVEIVFFINLRTSDCVI